MPYLCSVLTPVYLISGLVMGAGTAGAADATTEEDLVKCLLERMVAGFGLKAKGPRMLLENREAISGTCPNILSNERSTQILHIRCQIVYLTYAS